MIGDQGITDKLWLNSLSTCLYELNYRMAGTDFGMSAIVDKLG